jgi:hypothetical protein
VVGKAGDPEQHENDHCEGLDVFEELFHPLFSLRGAVVFKAWPLL